MSESNDRIFVKFTGLSTKNIFSLAMTCPKLTDNSATGFGNGGLQAYDKSGTPANFAFNLGEADAAYWNNSLGIACGPSYGECSY